MKQNSMIYLMKRTILGLGLAFLLTACNHQKTPRAMSAVDSMSAELAQDSTVYGVCGEGTAMHTLELIKDDGDTTRFFIEDGEGAEPIVKGGLLTGDRMAVVGHTVDGELVADNVINLTALLGRWTSIDKNFEIQEGGGVASNVQAETNPWTSWKIFNGHLLLNTDTFKINNLGSDSLYLENVSGIFTYKRQQ